MAHLSLSLLGPFQATLGKEPIAGFESNKVRALLAYLAVEAHCLARGSNRLLKHGAALQRVRQAPFGLLRVGLVRSCASGQAVTMRKPHGDTPLPMLLFPPVAMEGLGTAGIRPHPTRGRSGRLPSRASVVPTSLRNRCPWSESASATALAAMYAAGTDCSSPGTAPPVAASQIPSWPVLLLGDLDQARAPVWCG